jgi:hypothetical protein
VGSNILRTPIKLTTWAETWRFIFGGLSFFMVISNKTNMDMRFAIKISKDDPKFHFVNLWDGEKLVYLGIIEDKKDFFIPSSSKFCVRDRAIKSWMYVWRHLRAGRIPPKTCIYHYGYCCVCGKKINNRKYIATGRHAKCSKQ